MTQINPKFDSKLCRIEKRIIENKNHVYKVVVLSMMCDIDHYIQIFDAIFVSDAWAHTVLVFNHEKIPTRLLNQSIYIIINQDNDKLVLVV